MARLSDAYRRVPIRWRLAGGSAALTAVILLGFAAIVGVFATRQIESDFNAQTSRAADELQRRLRLEVSRSGRVAVVNEDVLQDYAASQGAVFRVVTDDGEPFRSSPRNTPFFPGPALTQIDPEFGDYRIETRPIPIPLASGQFGQVYLQYGRRVAEWRSTARRVALYLGLGVIGGTLLALLAGLATARRAMAPIAELSDAARRIERSRDPSGRLPRPEARDEIAGPRRRARRSAPSRGGRWPGRRAGPAGSRR